MLQDLMEEVKPKALSIDGTVHLKSWDEVEEYFALHLTPVAFGPKGQPVYSHIDIQNLNVRLPEDIEILMKD